MLRRIDKSSIIIFLIFLSFSWWLMSKSFGYDVESQAFRIARHQVGDFGLHLSLIRSFSWGSNMPPQLPFFPGEPLPYHYYFDLLVGILERFGTRIDIAFNGVSILTFTFLLFLIYKLPQAIFFKSRILGIISVILFITHSNTTFIDFLSRQKFSMGIFKNLWLLPDYINKGPFDGGIVSIFFTLNVFLNQRHLIMGLAISLAILLFLISRLLAYRKIATKYLILLGLIVGFSARIHALIFLATIIVIFCLFMLFGRKRLIVPILLPALLVFMPHLIEILNQGVSHPFFNPGFLATKPLTIASFIKFWALNLGVLLLAVPLGFAKSNFKQKKILLSLVPLFVIGNLFQLSFRIDHNHSIFNFFLIFANFYAAFLLASLWRGKFFKKLLFFVLLFFMTASGLVDLMAVKNDFQLFLPDAPRNPFMQWIKTSTQKSDIFLVRQEILDPVALAGRKNYLGHEYYLTVMGYDFADRKAKVKKFFEAENVETLGKMRKIGIVYIVIPKEPIADFTYNVNMQFFKTNLDLSYEDNHVLLFKL